MMSFLKDILCWILQYIGFFVTAATVISTTVTGILQILFFRKKGTSEDRALYIKFTDMMLAAHQKVYENVDKIDDKDHKAESYLLSYLNLMESIARLFLGSKLPKITRTMLFDEIKNNINTVYSDERTYKFFKEKSNNCPDGFEYIKMFHEKYMEEPEAALNVLSNPVHTT